MSEWYRKTKLKLHRYEPKFVLPDSHSIRFMIGKNRTLEIFALDCTTYLNSVTYTSHQ